MTTLPQVITIAQQKGGAGKTTLAIHIATALSQMGNKVTMIDIDPQGSTSEWFALRSKRFGKDYTGIKLLQTSGWKVNSEILSLKNKCDFVIIDSPPHIESDAKAAIRAAHLVIIPMQPSPTDLWATKATVELCTTENANFRILMNRVTPSSKLAITAKKEFANTLKHCLNNRVLFASSIQDGRSAMEVQPKSLAAEDVKSVVKEVLSALKAQTKTIKKAA